MSAPWINPPPPDRFELKNYNGRPFLLVYGGMRKGIRTRDGRLVEAAQVIVVSLSGYDEGREYDELLIFTQRVVGRLRDLAPATVLMCRGWSEGTKVDILEGAHYDNEAGHRWMAAHPGRLDELKRLAVDQLAKPLNENDNSGAVTPGYGPTTNAQGQAVPYPPPVPQGYAPQGQPPQAPPQQGFPAGPPQGYPQQPYPAAPVGAPPQQYGPNPQAQPDAPPF